jgi:hypothetical protein
MMAAACSMFSGKLIRDLGFYRRGEFIVTSQDFIKFWGKFFAFVLSVLIENSQEFKFF